MKKRGFLLVLCLMLLLGGIMPARGEAQGNPDVRALLQGISRYEMQKSQAADLQAWLDGDLAKQAGLGGEWYVLSLRQSGKYDFSAYGEGLAQYLQNTTVRSASSRQKFALMLLAAGEEDGSSLARDTLGKQGIMSWIFGLHLMNNGYEFPDINQQQAIDKILSLRLTDGGWALMGTASDVDVTAMTLQALAPHREQPDVQEAAESAFLLLSNRQLENGDLTSYGMANPESVAQVLMALSAWGMDGLKDARFIKNGNTLLDSIRRFRLADGSFSHQLDGAFNAAATAQVYLGLTAYERFLKGQSSIFVLDPMEMAAPAQTAWDYKMIVTVAAAGGALIGCLMLWLLKKRNWKNFAAVALLALAVIAFVQCTDFQSAENYYATVTEETGEIVGAVTMEIRCDTALGKTENAYLPQDGVMLPETKLDIRKDDTVYDLLLRATRENRLSLDASGAPGMMYVSGIQYLYEQDCGDLSGWMYLINGESLSVSCDQYLLQDGDRVQWVYSCEMGKDLE